MNWRSIAGLPIHAFIVAILVPIHIYSHNLNVLKFEDEWRGSRDIGGEQRGRET